MSKKLIKLLAALINIFIFYTPIFSQGNENKFVNQHLFPSKPDVASIGKFGDIPVNLATGQLDLSIPLYEISVNDFKIPVLLKYGFSGFRVEEVPGRMGLGWSFLCGGVISRQVRGIPDETPNGYIYNNGYVYKNYISPYINNGTLPPVSFLSAVVDGVSDTEPDKFNINAGNLSASFYLTDNRQAVIIPQKNYKIECDAGLNSFLVTDDKGVKYKFDKKELSQSETDGSPAPSSVSSWLLTEITFADNNQSINFEYQPYTFSQESISESSSKYLGTGGGCQLCATKYNGSLSRSLTNTTIDGFLLNKINFPEGSLEISNLSDVTNGTVGGMKLKNKKGQDVLEYNFFYENYGVDGVGKLLKTITKKSGSLTEPYYKLEYFPGLPENAVGNLNSIAISNITFSQDFWGYYNGKINTDILPDFQTENRSPSFNDAVKGALKKVVYPAGGATEIFYESNYVGKNYLNSFLYFAPQTFNKSKSVNSHVISDMGNDSDSDTLEILEDQVVEVSYSLTTQTLGSTAQIAIEGITNDTQCNQSNSQSGENDANGTTVYCLTVTKILDGEIAQNDPNSNNIASTNNTWKVKIKKGIYRLTSDVLNKGLASVQIRWNEFSETAPSGIEQYETGGIRLLRTQTNDSVTNTEIIRKYKYLNEGGTKSSGILLEMPIYDTYLTGGVDCDPNDWIFFETPCGIHVKFAQSRIPLATFQGSHILYNRVEVTEGANEENGKIVYQFSGRENQKGYFPFSPWENKEWRKGLVEGKKIYQASETDVRQTYTARYKPEAPNNNSRVEALKIGLKMQMLGLTTANFIIKRYFLQSDFSGLIADTTVIYSGVGQGLTTTSSYNYHSQYNYLNYSEAKNSKGEIRKEESKYPFNYQGIAVYDTMVRRNQLVIPIEQIVSDVTHNIELKRQINNHQLWSSNLALPVSVQTSVSGGQPETEVVYDQYDNNGNILQYTGKSGLQVSIVWGYGQKYPVAKIIGASYSDVLSSLSQTDPNLSYLQNMDNTALKTELNRIRDNLKINKPSAQVTTYIYKPLVGMISETDPNGVNTYYEYDDFNRLSVVRDNNNNILRKICFNYSGQPEYCNYYYNTVQNGSYTKNNCPVGYLGSSVNYTVPAATYISTVSQIEANNKAISDITANGQNYANSTGTCTSACNTGNCTGIGKKCINGACETGIKVYTASTYNSSTRKYTCTYHYEWSDGSWSGNYNQVQTVECPL